MKTNKSYSQRLKVTKKGKILARKPGQSHFRSRKNQETKIEKRSLQLISLPKKVINRFLPGNK